MIRDEIQKMSKDALKARDKETRSLLTSVLGKFIEEEKSGKFEEWTDQRQQEIVAKHVKGLRQGVEQMKTGPIVEGYHKEIALLEPFLPQMLDEAATRALVEPLAGNARNIGMFMGMVMKQHKGKVDPALVRRIGEELGLK